MSIFIGTPSFLSSMVLFSFFSFHFSWLGPELSSVAWSAGAQLIILFCFRFTIRLVVQSHFREAGVVMDADSIIRVPQCLSNRARPVYTFEIGYLGQYRGQRSRCAKTRLVS